MVSCELLQEHSPGLSGPGGPCPRGQVGVGGRSPSLFPAAHGGPTLSRGVTGLPPAPAVPPSQKRPRAPRLQSQTCEECWRPPHTPRACEWRAAGNTPGLAPFRETTHTSCSVDVWDRIPADWTGGGARPGVAWGGRRPGPSSGAAVAAGALGPRSWGPTVAQMLVGVGRGPSGLWSLHPGDASSHGARLPWGHGQPVHGRSGSFRRRSPGELGAGGSLPGSGNRSTLHTESRVCVSVHTCACVCSGTCVCVCPCAWACVCVHTGPPPPSRRACARRAGMIRSSGSLLLPLLLSAPPTRSVLRPHPARRRLEAVLCSCPP